MASPEKLHNQSVYNLSTTVQHKYVQLKNGMTYHYVFAMPPNVNTVISPTTTVILIHGFPDSWYGWRRQIPLIAAAGFRVICPDMRGYGETTAPQEDGAYCMKYICEDLSLLQEALNIPKAIYIGHDWGGTFVWNMVQAYPERVLAVGAVCTPFQATPQTNPWPRMVKNGPGSRFDYQIYFQKEYDAIGEMDKDIGRSYKISHRSHETKFTDVDDEVENIPPTERNGWMNHIAPDAIRDEKCLVSEEELEYYIYLCKKAGGFHGGVKWYRNVESNWKYMRQVLTERGMEDKPMVYHEALMITAGKDAVLTPTMVDKYTVPFVPNLTRGHVEDAGHWVLVENWSKDNGIPQFLIANRMIVNWLLSSKVTNAIRNGGPASSISNSHL